MKLLPKSLPLPIVLLIVFIVTETLCGTYLLENKVRIDIVSIVYFIAGIGIAIIPMIPFRNSNIIPSENNISRRFNKIILYSFYFFIVGYFIFFMTGIMQTRILDHRISDTLPQIKVMCQRLLSGEKIYAPIPEIWDGKQPPYMPLMWLPFTAAEYLGIDVRWTTTVFLLGRDISYYLKILPSRFAGNPLILISTFISLFLLLNFLLVKDKVTLGNTEEGIVIGYYLFLGFALAKKLIVSVAYELPVFLGVIYFFFFMNPERTHI